LLKLNTIVIAVNSDWRGEKREFIAETLVEEYTEEISPGAMALTTDKDGAIQKTY
jgi:hypothetical protein